MLQLLGDFVMQSCSESTLDMILISPGMSSPLLLFVTKDYLLAQLNKQGLGIRALDSLFNAIVLNQILYALPVYFGYLTEGHKDMLRSVFKRANRMGFTFYRHDLDLLNETSQYKLFFAAAGLNYIVFITYSPSNPSHLAPCTLDNAGTILFYQISDMNLINATLLLAHFLITSNISCVLRVPMSMYFVF